MPSGIHERVFRIRHYECDANGHLYNANYVRLMQETALDAGLAESRNGTGENVKRCEWVTALSDVKYLRPLAYGDSARVKTWVSDVQGSRLRRVFELYSVNANELAAHASIEAEYTDVDSHVSAVISPGMIAAGTPASILAAYPAQAFPPAPPAPPTVFKMHVRVSWRDVDPASRANSAMYLSYINDCGMEFAASNGWTLNRMWSAGFGILVRRQQIEYLGQACMDDELEIAMWLSDLKPVSSIWHFTITRVRDGAMLARARALYVWIDPATGRLRKVTPEILRFLKTFESPGLETSAGQRR